MKLNYQNWLTKKLDVADEEYKLNNNLASHLAKKGFRAIIMQYTGMMPKQVIKLLKLEKNLWKELKGVGADLGGGIGCISSTIALKKDVKKIYCIDAVKNVVTKCQNVVKKKY